MSFAQLGATPLAALCSLCCPATVHCCQLAPILLHLLKIGLIRTYWEFSCLVWLWNSWTWDLSLMLPPAKPHLHTHAHTAEWVNLHLPSQHLAKLACHQICLVKGWSQEQSQAIVPEFAGQVSLVILSWAFRGVLNTCTTKNCAKSRSVHNQHGPLWKNKRFCPTNWPSARCAMRNRALLLISKQCCEESDKVTCPVSWNQDSNIAWARVRGSTSP